MPLKAHGIAILGLLWLFAGIATACSFVNNDPSPPNGVGVQIEPLAPTPTPISSSDEIEQAINKEVNRISSGGFIYPENDREVTFDHPDKIDVTFQASDMPARRAMAAVVQVKLADVGCFVVTPLRDEKQQISDNELYTWSWSIQPTKSGICTLVFDSKTIINNPDGSQQTIQNPSREIRVNVTDSPLAFLARVVSSNFDTILLAILGGIGTIVIAFIMKHFNLSGGNS